MNVCNNVLVRTISREVYDLFKVLLVTLLAMLSRHITPQRLYAGHPNQKG